MLYFILGILAGLLLSILFIVILLYFKKVIVNKVEIASKQIETSGPRPKGYIVEPPSKADDFREKIIKENDRKGIDTPIESLM